MKKRAFILGTAGAIILSGSIFAACSMNETYTLNSNEVTIELGETLDTDISTYVECSERIKNDIKIDVSGVDTSKVGSYKATVTYKEETMDFTVNVEDTTAPTVYLANDGVFKIMVGETLAKDDIVSQMDDLAGISKYYILSDDNTSENETISYPEEGDYVNKIVVVDNNGNSTEKDFTVHVIPDYLAHVSGFHDWTIEQNADIDFTKGIETDERIASVTAGTIDVSQPGEQTLVYSITGDDNETVVEQSVTVTVVDAVTAQSKANNNEVVYVSGNATKEKEVPKTKSSEKTASNSTSAGTTTKSNSTSAGSNNAQDTNTGTNSNEAKLQEELEDEAYQDWLDSLEPGQTWDLSEPNHSCEILDGSGTGYSGTINW